jgi:predicted ABC-type ATPase
LAKPKLVILAGPNGAGKSTFAENADLKFISELGIQSFDYDLEYKKLYDKYQSIMTSQIEENLSLRAKELFEERAYQALADKTHFSFQTNYDKEYTENWREKFEAEGFETQLYFLYVESMDLCIKRVHKRVLEGGHSVPKHQIIERYKLGLINYDATFQFFDSVVLIDTSKVENRLLLEIRNKNLVYIDTSYIDVVLRHNLPTSLSWIRGLV